MLTTKLGHLYCSLKEAGSRGGGMWSDLCLGEVTLTSVVWRDLSQGKLGGSCYHPGEK